MDSTLARLAELKFGETFDNLTTHNEDSSSSSKTVSRANTPTSSNDQPTTQPTSTPYVKQHSNHVAFDSPLPITKHINPQTLVCPGSDLAVPCEYEEEPEFQVITKNLHALLKCCQFYTEQKRAELYGYIAYFSLRRAAYDVVKARKEAEAAAAASSST